MHTDERACQFAGLGNTNRAEQRQPAQRRLVAAGRAGWRGKRERAGARELGASGSSPEGGGVVIMSVAGGLGKKKFLPVRFDFYLLTIQPKRNAALFGFLAEKSSQCQRKYGVPIVIF